MTAQLVQLPTNSLGDIPGGLRRLADSIEAGEFGEVASLAWTFDSDQGTALGMLGVGHPGDAHLLFSVAAAAMVKKVLDVKGLIP